MKHLTYDREQKQFSFSYDETSEKFPTILSLREKSDSNTFWASTINSYDFPVFFNIYSLEDVIIEESGEYIKRAYAAVDPNSSKYFLSNEHTNLKHNEIEIVFNPPRKITYLVNFSKDFGLYQEIKKFKCPKTGSYSQNKLINNEIIQKLILSPNDIIHIYHHKNSHSQELINGQSEHEFKAIKLENEILKSLVKENSLNILTQIEANDFSDLKKSLIDNLKTTLDIEKFLQTKKKIALKFFENNQSNELNKINEEGKFIVISADQLANEENFSIYLEKRLNEIINNIGYVDLYVLVEEHFENTKELSDLNPKFKNNHLGQTCFMKSHSQYPELLNLYYRFSLNEVVRKKDSMLFPDEIKNTYIVEKLKNMGKEFLEKMNALIDKFDVDKEFELLMFSIDFKLNRSENNSDEKIKVVGDKSIVPRISRIESIDKNVLFNFNENFYFNNQACTKLNSFLNYILNSSYFYMFRGIRFAALSLHAEEDQFYEECKRNGIEFFIIDSRYFEPDYTNKFDKKYLIQGDIYDPKRYEEESERLAKLLVDMDIHVMINFHNDTYPFANLLREKMRKQVSLLPAEKQKEIYRNFHCYNVNTKIDYDKAEFLINKKKVYNLINTKAQEKNAFSLGSNFDVIDDDNYQTYEVKCKKILKIDNSTGNIFLHL